jgi:hypothetical protein
MSKWISVNDRLPVRTCEGHKAQRFLVCMDGRIMDIMIYMYDEKYWTDDGQPHVHNSRITHWMPIPEPPEAGK